MGGSEGVKSFEDLWIWQQARVLVRDMYRDLESGNGKRDFGFRDQVQRAGISIMNNISEGFERGTNKEFARFLEIAKGSAGEVRSMYYLAADLDYVSGQIADERKSLCRRISAAIASLASYLREHGGKRPRHLSEVTSVRDLLVPDERFGTQNS